MKQKKITSKMMACLVILALVLGNLGGFNTPKAEAETLGQNLVANGDFEAVTDGMANEWQHWWGAASIVTGTDAYIGSSLLIDGAGGGAQFFGGVEKGKTYRLTAVGKVDTGVGNLLVKLKKVGDEGDASDYKALEFNTTNYTEQSIEFTLPNAEIEAFGIAYYNNGDKFYLDNIVLSEVISDTPTDPGEPTSPELITNGDFEAVTDGKANSWDIWWGTTSIVTGADAYSGNSLLVDGSGGGAQFFGGVERGKTYKLMAVGKVDTGNGQILVKLKKVGDVGDASDYKVLEFSNTAYTSQSVEFTLPDAEIEAFGIAYYNGGNKFYLDNISLIEVKASTPGDFNLPSMSDGNFSVIDGKIYTPDYNEFIIKGTNVNGPYWPWSRDTVQDASLIIDCWKFNTVRVNCFPRMTYHGVPESNNLEDIVNTFTSKRVVTMIENHDYTGYYPGDETVHIPDTMSNSGTIIEIRSLENFKNWWIDIANQYKDNPYVWFNLMNEPGMAPYGTNEESIQRWYEVSDYIIQAIRATGAQNVIVLDEHSYGQGNGYNYNEQNSAILTKGSILNNSYNNLVFSLHMYNEWANGTDKLADMIEKIHGNGMAFIIGEYGDDGSINQRSSVEALWSSAIPRKVGRIVWSWDCRDTYNLTTAEPGGGWQIDVTDGTKPTNLSWIGEKIWEDNHAGEIVSGIDLGVNDVILSNIGFTDVNQYKALVEIKNFGDTSTIENTVLQVDLYSGYTKITSMTYNKVVHAFNAIYLESNAFVIPEGTSSIRAIISDTSNYGQDVVANNQVAEYVFDNSLKSTDLAIVNIKVGNNNTFAIKDRVKPVISLRNNGINDLVNKNIQVNFTVNGERVANIQQSITLAPGETIDLSPTIDWMISQEDSFVLVAKGIFDDEYSENDNSFCNLIWDGMMPNLIANPDFEAGFSNWNNWSNASITEDADNVHAGTKAAQVGTGGEWGDGFGQLLQLKANTTYRLSAWGKHDSVLSGDPTEVGYDYMVNGDKIGHSLKFTETTYTLKTIEFTTPSLFTNGKFYVWKTYGENATFFVDDIELVEVRETPNPTIVSAEIQPVVTHFDKYYVRCEDVSTSIKWNDASAVIDVKFADSTIGTSAYAISGDQLIIKKEYLATQRTGTLTLAVEFNVGDTATLVVQINDTTPVVPPTQPSTPTPEPTPEPPLSEAIGIKGVKAKATLNIYEPDEVGIMKATIVLSADQLLEEIEKNGTSKKPLEIIIPVSSKKLLQQMEDDEVKAAEVTVQITKALSFNKKARINIILGQETLEAAKDGKKNVKVSVVDEEGRENYTWSFTGEDLSNSKQDVSEVNLSLKVYALDLKEQLNELRLENKKAVGVVVNFSHEGILPAQATVKIHVGNQKGLEPGDKIYLYHYNRITGKLETLPYSSGYEVDEDGYITVHILHCSDYVVLSDKAESDMITSLRNQISITPLRKTLYVGTADSGTKIQVELPVTLELVDDLKDDASNSAVGKVTVTYKSSNDKVATVDSNGKVTAKGKGTALITTTVKLYSGKTKTVITTITVKEPYIKLDMSDN